ncbi:MAG: hypothetical protein GC183_11955 [Thiobacillus sp.]|nr:hypothetical protein [Thiobacillus sp.]
MRQLCHLFLLPLFLSLHSEAHASQKCAATVSELGAMFGDQTFPLKWEETTMDDGKPLMMSITEVNGSLILEFTKTGEGLWMESPGVICNTGTDLEARFTGEQIRLGPAAGWVLRSVSRNGVKFTLTRLGSDRLRVATSSWSGIFAPTAR